MPKKYENLKIGLDDDLSEKLKWLEPDLSHFNILRKSVDARKRHEPHFIYSVEVYNQGEAQPDPYIPIEPLKGSIEPIIIVGTGPAGLFAALRAVERGIPCLVFEQGSDCSQRLKKINRFWRHGELDPLNNVSFGEGGAGLYSDGKLITRIKSPHIPYVMDRLIQFGAPEEIRYLSNPHVGSDKIRRVIPHLRKYLVEHGAQIFFDSKVTELNIENGRVNGVILENGKIYKSPSTVLACGHSAEDFFHNLNRQGVFMEGKSFALGLRIEHPQHMINKIQYRQHSEHPKLGAANYRLTHHNKNSGVGVYSFCMCPGGYVLHCSTENGTAVSNGMSNYNRNSKYANAAIVVSLDYETHFKNQGIFGGLSFRKSLETLAYEEVIKNGGTKQLPGQKVLDFFEGKKSLQLPNHSSPSGVISTRLDQVIPNYIKTPLYQALEKFNQKMSGFLSEQGLFYGVESRTSCPIRMTRNPETMQSISHPGLYPAGEGAGYAGGITSAACDGINVVEAIVKNLQSSALSGISPTTDEESREK